MTKYFVYSPRGPGLVVLAASELEARRIYVKQNGNTGAVYVMTPPL